MFSVKSNWRHKTRLAALLLNAQIDKKVAMTAIAGIRTRRYGSINAQKVYRVKLEIVRDKNNSHSSEMQTGKPIYV